MVYYSPSGFNVFTTKSRFFTTHPSILTTHPFIITTQLYSLTSEICGDLGLGRHAVHQIKISGDALIVSTPNICPLTITVSTPYVRVIRTGAASRCACRNMSSSHCRYPSFWASRWGVLGGQHRFNFFSIHWLHCLHSGFKIMQTMLLSLTGRLMMVKKGPSIWPKLADGKGQSILLMMKYKIPS
jgi:hypothetical protein